MVHILLPLRERLCNPGRILAGLARNHHRGDPLPLLLLLANQTRRDGAVDLQLLTLLAAEIVVALDAVKAQHRIAVIYVAVIPFLVVAAEEGCARCAAVPEDVFEVDEERGEEDDVDEDDGIAR